MQIKLSTTLRNIRDQLRGHEITDGQVIIRGEALSSLVETLDFAADAAAALERELEEGRTTPQVQARPAGRVVPLPRRAHHALHHRRQSPWRPTSTTTPGRVAGHDDDGGDAA